jgi:hypothetical protein
VAKPSSRKRSFRSSTVMLPPSLPGLARPGWHRPRNVIVIVIVLAALGPWSPEQLTMVLATLSSALCAFAVVMALEPRED